MCSDGNSEGGGREGQAPLVLLRKISFVNKIHFSAFKSLFVMVSECAGPQLDTPQTSPLCVDETLHHIQGVAIWMQLELLRRAGVPLDHIINTPTNNPHTRTHAKTRSQTQTPHAKNNTSNTKLCNHFYVASVFVTLFALPGSCLPPPPQISWARSCRPHMPA